MGTDHEATRGLGNRGHVHVAIIVVIKRGESLHREILGIDLVGPHIPIRIYPAHGVAAGSDRYFGYHKRRVRQGSARFIELARCNQW